MTAPKATAEQKRVFGANVRLDVKGNPIEKGIGNVHDGNTGRPAPQAATHAENQKVFGASVEYGDDGLPIEQGHGALHHRRFVQEAAAKKAAELEDEK